MHDTDQDAEITERTEKNYRAGWRRYTEWCAAEGLDPLDGDGEQVAKFLWAMYDEGRALGTVKLWRVAVAHRYDPHREVPIYDTDAVLQKRPDPTKTGEVRRALKRMTKNAPRAGRSAKVATAMTRDKLAKVLEVSALRRACESEAQARKRHAEMSAVLALMYDGLLRCDEMAAARWEDLADKPHPKSGHYKLRITSSKTDQNGNGAYAFVSRQTWQALQRWRAMSDDPNGRICSSNSANALGGRIRRLGEAAGLKLSGHSPRRGAACDMAEAGATEQQLKQAGRWTRSDTVARYIDEGDAANGGMAIMYGDAPEPTPAPAAGEAWVRMIEQIETAEVLLRYRTALEMATALGADRDAPAVVAARKLLLEAWPLEDPPPECAAEGCLSFVLVLDPKQIYCTDECQHAARNARKREQRRQS